MLERNICHAYRWMGEPPSELGARYWWTHAGVVPSAGLTMLGSSTKLKPCTGPGTVGGAVVITGVAVTTGAVGTGVAVGAGVAVGTDGAVVGSGVTATVGSGFVAVGGSVSGVEACGCAAVVLMGPALATVGATMAGAALPIVADGDATYEAVAAGCAVITGPDSGNIAAFVGETGQGQVLADEAALAAAFESGQILQLARAQRRPMLYDLIYSALTLDLAKTPTP